MKNQTLEAGAYKETNKPENKERLAELFEGMQAMLAKYPMKQIIRGKDYIIYYTSYQLA